MPTPDLTPAVATLKARVPGLMAVYAFGSRIQGTAGPDSDLDLAVLVGDMLILSCCGL